MVEAMGGGRGRTGTVRSADNLVHDLIAVANDLRRRVDVTLADLGYEDRRPGFAPLLSLVWRHGVPQGRLAQEMGVSAQAASQAVGLAEQAGYVTRVVKPEDRRSKLVVLTDLGRAFVADGAAAIIARAVDYSGVLGARRFARFDNSLGRLQSGLGLGKSDDPVATLTPRTSIVSVSVLSNRAMRYLHDEMHARGHGLISAGQNLVLVHIGPDGARSSELARVQRVSRQAVSAVLHDLEDLGYVRRRGDASDGRGVVFVPTQRGRRVLDDYVRGIDVLEDQYRAVLGDARLDELARSARDLSRMLGLEHVFALAEVSPAVTDVPALRRQGELADLGGELLRWLGPSDVWWLAGYLRQQVIDGIERPMDRAVEESR